MEEERDSGYLQLIARTLLALVFLFFGYEQIRTFGSTVYAISAVGIQHANIAAVIALILEFGGSLLLILGYRARLAAVALIVFTALATYFYHRDIHDAAQLVMVLKNLSIVGGLLMVIAYGPGKLTLKTLVRV